jgi:hypothetical protein
MVIQTAATANCFSATAAVPFSCCFDETATVKMQAHFIGEAEMAKKMAARKKASKRSKVVKLGRAKPVRPRPPARTPRKCTPPKPKMQEPEYGPTFFLTADSDTALALEIDGTPHPMTIQSYRLGKADIRSSRSRSAKYFTR